MESTLKDRRIAVLVTLVAGVLAWSTYWALPLLVIASLNVVARDGGIELLSPINRVLKGLVSILAVVYGAISLGFTALHAWRGQMHDPKLSMGILKALRGRRQVAA